ncbi:hypothetical protein [Mucilaginibacter ginsenosidivorax]|uniref:Uncharacterized protein n=1 Tax=Mucilaginibacter ginsenosidivorax TaxID=862126 RepID=A0A5B8VST1_9SPHI|nr:hypothetical protein [Mucilaginibacter ginsenosidivorax]QEC74704.1 hypothetical protein FSB76_01600 [Mucilaginibacter ginsenosidivorax]
MTDPINLQVRRADNTWDIIEAALLPLEEEKQVKATGTFQLYRGFPNLSNTKITVRPMSDIWKA